MTSPLSDLRLYLGPDRARRVAALFDEPSLSERDAMTAALKVAAESHPSDVEIVAVSMTLLRLAALRRVRRAAA